MKATGVVPTPPEPTTEAIARGRSIYRLVQCWQCHGITGQGNGPSAPNLMDDKDKGEPIAPANFTRGYLKSGDKPEDVYRSMMTGLEGSPMPSFKGSLNLARDSFEDLSGIEPLIPSQELEQLKVFIASLPTSEQFDKLPDAEKEAKVIGCMHGLDAVLLGLLLRRVLRGSVTSRREAAHL